MTLRSADKSPRVPLLSETVRVIPVRRSENRVCSKERSLLRNVLEKLLPVAVPVGTTGYKEGQIKKKKPYLLFTSSYHSPSHSYISQNYGRLYSQRP